MTEFSGPSALGEQQYATERVPSIRSDWLKRPWSLGRDRKMVLKRWCTDFKTTKIARNITKSWKIYNLAEILTVRGCQDPTKFVTKADPCYIPRLWCASSGALPWRPIAVVFVKRSHQGDMEDRGGMMGHCWAWAQLPELWGYRIYCSLFISIFGYRSSVDIMFWVGLGRHFVLSSFEIDLRNVHSILWRSKTTANKQGRWYRWII